MYAGESDSDSGGSDECWTDKEQEGWFRASVCLARYFGAADARRRCYVLAPRRRRVRWLERRLHNLFALPAGFHLSVDGHLLPSSEPLALVNPQDTIDVLPFQEKQDNYTINSDTNISLMNNRTIRCSSVSHTTDYSAPPTQRDAHTSNINIGITHQDESDGAHTQESRSEVPATHQNGTDSLSCNNVVERNGGGEALLTLKQQALALLESCAPAEPPGAGAGPARRRRRVRRRRAPAEHSSHTELPPKPDRVTESVSSSEASASASPCKVARNDTVCLRKPRLVHSLDH